MYFLIFLKEYLKAFCLFSQLKCSHNLQLLQKLNKNKIKRNIFIFNISFFPTKKNFLKKNFVKTKKKNPCLESFLFDEKSSTFLFDSILYIQSYFTFKRKKIVLKEEINLLYFPFWLFIGLNNIKKLNNIQSKLFSHCIGSDSNLLLSSPTGTGKTIIAIFCILRIFINSICFKKEMYVFSKNLFKILYIAPFKTIIKEKIIYFEQSLSFLGLKVTELTGDFAIMQKEFDSSNIIIGTPEKIDLFTREKQKKKFFSQIRLLIIDEIHLLAEERGPILEQIILRFLLDSSDYNKDCRIIGLSATLPNYQDIGKFIYANSIKSIYYFDDLYREIPTNYLLVAFKKKKASIKKADILNKILLEKTLKILKNSLYNKVIIFVHSRKDTVKTGIFLYKNLKDLSIKMISKHNIEGNFNNKYIFELNDETSKFLSFKGIGVHHAGLSGKDKMIAENLFLIGITRILVSTSTLAWGVNLPATHVIIKGTKIYCPNKTYWTELSDLNIIQMLGRVARIKNQIKNEGILLTSYKYFSYYKKLFKQNKAIESNFIFFLPDSFNIECTRYAITNFINAKIWLSNSFFWIRLHRILLEGINNQNKNFIKKLIFSLNDLLVFQIINQLICAGMIKYNRKKKTISSTNLGCIASKYGINHQTIMIIIDRLLPNFTQSELINIFSFSYEFTNLNIRRDEKEELKRLATICTFPIKENSDTILFKVNVLFQSYISNFKIKNMSLAADLIYVGKISGRYFLSLFQISLNKHWAKLTLYSLEFFQFIKNRSIPGHTISKYVAYDFSISTKFKIIKKFISETNSIKFFSKKKKKLISSKKILLSLKEVNEQIPFLELSLHLQPITRNTVKISLLIKTKTNFEKRNKNEGLGIWFFIEDQLSDLIITHQYFWVKQKNKRVENLITTYIPIFDDPFSPYFLLKLITDNFIGCSCYLPIDLTKVSFPINYPLLTEFLNLKSNSSFRIFTGFRGGNLIYQHFLSSFKILPISVNQNTNFIIKNANDKNFFLTINNSKEIYSQLSAFPFLFSKKSYNLFFIFIGNESINLKTGKLRKSCFSTLGISIELIKIEITKNYKHKLHSRCIFISSVLENIQSEQFLKKINSFRFVYIIEFLHLIGNLNFSNQIEIFFNNSRDYFQIYKDNHLISISSFFLNNFNFIEWFGLKSFISTSLCKKSNLNSKNFIKKFQFEQINEFESKNLIESYVFKLKKFYKEQANQKSRKLVVVCSKSIYLENLIIRSINILLQYPCFQKKRIQKILSKTIYKKKINKLFSNLNFGIINESDNFEERRVIEELFCGTHLKFIFISSGTFCISCSEKLNSYFGLILNNQLKSQQIDLLTSYFFSFVDRFDLFISIITKKNFSGFLFYFQELVVESKINNFLLENLLTFIVKQGRIDFYLLIEYVSSSFFFFRINNNPNYYGFGDSFSIKNLFKKIINSIIIKLWLYNYIAIFKHNLIETRRMGLFIIYYFLKEKIFRKIFIKKKNTLDLNKIIKLLANIEEASFFLNHKDFNNNFKKKKFLTKKFIQKILTTHHFFNRLKNIHISACITIKKIFNIWVIIFAYKFHLKFFFLILEINRLILCRNIKNESVLLDLPEINKFTVFLLGKIHKIFFYKCLKNQQVNFKIFKQIKIKNCKYSIQKIKKFYNIKYLFLKLHLIKINKILTIKVKIQENANLLLFSRNYFRNTIKCFWIQNLFYIIIGNVNKNKLIFWKKFYLPTIKFTHFDVNIKNNFKKLKIFIFNQRFCYLDKEFVLNLND
nr:U5snrnp200 [Cryptomonas curvata]